MSNCTYDLRPDKLPKIVARVDYYLFKELDAQNISAFQLVKNKADEQFFNGLLTSAHKRLQDDIATYKATQDRLAQNVSVFKERLEALSEDHALYTDVQKLHTDSERQHEAISKIMGNLVEIDALWNQVVANVLTYSNTFSVRNNFDINDEGVAEISDNEQENAANVRFDSEEPSPLSIIDKSVEYLIRSLNRKVKNAKGELSDPWTEFGQGESVDYANFTKRLLSDLDGLITPTQVLNKLESLKGEIPEYQQLLDKIDIRNNRSSESIQLFINFFQSFNRQTVPIYQTLLTKEGNLILTESSNNKKKFYESRFKGLFQLRGTNEAANGKQIAFRNDDGSWVLDQRSVKPLEDLDLSKPEAKLEFLEMMGFDFSEQTKAHLIKTAKDPRGLLYEKNNDTYKSTVHILRNYLVETLRTAPLFKELAKKRAAIKEMPLEITNPIEVLQADNYFLKFVDRETRNKLTKYELKSAKGMFKMKYAEGQNNVIAQFINLEMEMNPALNVIKSMRNAEGKLESAQQMFNNFGVINHFLSNAEQYPTLNAIWEAEPSMFWLNPELNPMIRNSFFLNSLFDMKADKNGQYQRRMRDGKAVQILLNNYNGLATQSEGDGTAKAYKTTKLNRLDKLLMDIHNFTSGGTRLKETLRLGDKGTALSITMDWYWNESTKKFQRHPIQSDDTPILDDNRFHDYMVNQLKDYANLKWLNEKHGFLTDHLTSGKHKYKSSGKVEVISSNLNDFGALSTVISQEVKDQINAYIEKADSLEKLDALIDAYANKENKIRHDVKQYFRNYANKLFTELKKEYNDDKLLGKVIPKLPQYVVNSWITNNEQLRLFFGDVIYFKDFHKRASKDSATGHFLFVDDLLIDALQDHSTEYGQHHNLAARKLLEQLRETGAISGKEFHERLQRQQLGKSYRSATIEDVEFDSSYIEKMVSGIEKVRDTEMAQLKNLEEGYKNGRVKEGTYQNYKTYVENKYKLYQDSLKSVIQDKYNGTEADGQGLCTLDFYRTMSILTGEWTPAQEQSYKKMVLFQHYDDLYEKTQNPRYKYLRDKNEPTDTEVFFPPKKFQYAGPIHHEKTYEGKTYNTNVPVFDKFSLAPLLPHMLKGTANEALNKRMLYEGISYVKYASGTKVATAKQADKLYLNTNREFQTFDEMLGGGTTFASEHTLFMTHLKEQVKIEEDIHESVIFGSQARKLFFMNLFNVAKAHDPKFQKLYDDYVKYMQDMVDVELADLYAEMGVSETIENGKVKLGIADKKKLYNYLKDEITKKDADISLKRLVSVNDKGELDFPIDATVQAQVLENMIVSAFNNRVVRYKTNGSMLIQVASTGFEKPNTFNKQASKEAAAKYGSNDLAFYEVQDGRITAMEVKIALAGQWKALLYLMGTDGQPIRTRERLNEALKNKEWVKKNEQSLQMVAYRIPTQGKNFLDVMQVKEFLPEEAGDVVIMPSEVVVKSGSDYDIDKMFVFYPNLYQPTGDELVDRRVGQPVSFNYESEEIKNRGKRQGDLKANVQNKLYRTMIDTLLHPSNYLELVTPSTNFHIDPYIDEIYEKLQAKRGSNYVNGDVLDEVVNLDKFISLMKGKSDLGIAAVANTFNVLYQLVGAKANQGWLIQNDIQTLFQFPAAKTVIENLEAPGLSLVDMSYGEMFDEDGVFKSEFFSEFINAFVDVAKDDYVFTINMVTALTPIAFYMKFAGLGTRKIFGFLNQPIIRGYIKNLSRYTNLSVQTFLSGELDEKTIYASNLAKKDTLRELGIVLTKESNDGFEEEVNVNFKNLSKYFAQNFTVNPAADTKLFEAEALIGNIKTKDFELKNLPQGEIRTQLLIFLEWMNLKQQSDSMTDSTRFLNFDTKPYKSSFDVHYRNQAYQKAVYGYTERTRKGDIHKEGSVLSPETLQAIHNNTMISPLQMGRQIASILEIFAPLRNSPQINEFILQKADDLKKNMENQSLRTTDDMERFARVFKNDLIVYVLQNFLPNTDGEKVFQHLIGTDKNINEYLMELMTTGKLLKLFNGMRNSEKFVEIRKRFPLVDHVIVERGRKQPALVNFKVLSNVDTNIEKKVFQDQFQQLISQEAYPEAREFFRNLAVFGLIQSGLNKSDLYFNDLVPVEFLTPVLADAYETMMKKADKRGREEAFQLMLEDFYKLFLQNNTNFDPKVYDQNLREKVQRTSKTRDVSKRGKWYRPTELKFEKAQAPKATAVTTAPSATTGTTLASNPALEEKRAAAKAYFESGMGDEALARLGTNREFALKRIQEFTTLEQFDDMAKKLCKR